MNTSTENEEGLSLSRLHGLLELEDSEFRLGCDLETLDTNFDITIGGVSGKLSIPCEPDWPDTIGYLGEIRLNRPSEAPDWPKVFWGRPYSYGTKNGDRQAYFGLFTLYMYFDVPFSQMAEASQSVYDDSSRWLYQFMGYYDLLFKSKLNPSGSDSQLLPKVPMLDIFALKDGKRKVLHKRPVGRFYFRENKDYSPLSVKERYVRACSLASEGREMPLPYQLQLGAYSAFNDRDLRKAVIETASASEIALSQALLKQLQKDGITYADAILKKYPTLGGRVELAEKMKLKGVNRPKCQEDLIKPRNNAIHTGQRPSIQTTLKAIAITDNILANLPDALF